MVEHLQTFTNIFQTRACRLALPPELSQPVDAMGVRFLALNKKSSCLGTSPSPGSIVVEMWHARVVFVTPGLEPWAFGLCAQGPTPKGWSQLAMISLRLK
jgi:hypothetical protein